LSLNLSPLAAIHLEIHRWRLNNTNQYKIGAKETRERQTRRNGGASKAIYRYSSQQQLITLFETMTKANISKAQLIEQLQQWNNKQISAEQLQDWMVTHYDPDEVDIGLGEAQWTIEAMNIVMNEYEIAKLTKLRQENAQLAIDFIDTDESRFNQTRHLFLQEGFKD
jgi:hypothetical protein